ncbi:uncharacterized protein LOC132719793 isoform X3 [Ruditapes philippinarum]|uniref:uncharacterized protein LOC132719793 isoform X3 n=1 Tax=Ruditapes philippinarum TaxID=129788 RepID=UPI00295B648B|nr:uncharacterized protein LOC132719793 isoform X3 [Ruditapes philippinarum]
MAAGKPRNDHEEMRVRVEQAQREVLPAMELEKKEIKMTVRLPIQAVPSIVMTTVENGKMQVDKRSHDADRIVGITGGLQGDSAKILTAEHPVIPQTTQNGEKSDKTTLPPIKTPSSPKLGSRLTVEQSHSIIEKTEDLMEFFEDQKKSHKHQKRPSRKKPRTPSPSPVRQSVGLDHLDNLVRLMEQLGSLRDENSRLKNRCDYLESTKTLLIAKSNLDEEESEMIYESNSLPRAKKSKSVKTIKDGNGVRIMRPRLPSAEDAKCIEIDLGDSSSDQALPRNKSKVFKRSFSTGSLEVPSDIMEQSGEDELISAQRLLSDPFEGKRSSKILKSPEAKRKSKFSKWAKVKKVLTKQQLSENISSGIKSIKGLGKGAYLRYGSISGRELTVPSHAVAESRSVDSGVGSGMDGEYQDVRKSTSSNEPPSPTRFVERHIDVPTPQVDDCEGIWLGPPEWIEKEREKEKELLKQTTSLSESPKSEPGDISSPHSVSGYEGEGEKFLQLPIPRRQSSPLLIDSPDDEEYTESELKRTVSCKDPEHHDETFHKTDKVEKKHRTPWGKMKNIIHTRKDSGKLKHRKSGRESDSFGFEEVSETDLEVYDELKYIHEYLEGPVSRSTPKASPVVFRQKQRDKSASSSPPEKHKEAQSNVPMTATGTIDVSALLGGVSDEFTRKLQEWEEMKGKRTSGHFKESAEFSESISYESAGAVSPEFLKKLEEWEKLKALKSSSAPEQKRDSQIEQEIESSSDEGEEATTSPDKPRQSVNVAEIQLKLSDSFSRKMEEWERQKYRRQTTHAEDKDLQQKPSFKERPKSKKTKEEKEREKLGKMREREIMRVEREQQKLEKERMRIEKERLKALEREAKIEKMKGRLSQPDMEANLKNPVLSPLSEYKVTTDFARKLHEWEVLKGKETSTSMYLEAQKRNLQFHREYRNAHSILRRSTDDLQTTTDTDEPPIRKTSSESDEMFLMEESEKEDSAVKVKGQKPPPLSLIPCFDSPEPSPGAPLSDDSSLDDHTSETTDSMTAANIASLEKANIRLLEELRQTEFEYNSLQDEVRVLNDRLINFRNEHVLELDLYKKQLIEGQSPREISFDTKHMSQTLMHLEDKILELKKFGEQLAMSMEGAATVEGEESINNRLVDLLDKMRLLLQQATLSGENTLEEVSKKSSALHNFEKLYSQAMQLQMQMNNLRLSQLERNKEIMNMKRHLLLQEANNLLLQADVTRREAELLYYKEYSQKRVPIKRWNTYSGKEDRTRSSLPVPESSRKQSIFQRVQRLRSARPILPSTTDSDSDVPTKTPPRRESPRVRKRESPKTRKKESPKPRRKESPSMRRKEKESPISRRREPPKLQPLVIPEGLVYEKCTDRKEEYVPTTSSDVISNANHDKAVIFSTATLPTAKMVLPKDISPHELNGVPRKSRSPGVETIYEQKGKEKASEVEKVKFPELLIPEWKKQTDRQKRAQYVQEMPTIDPDDVFDSDNEVFITPETVREQAIVPAKVKFEERPKLLVNKSFESETSEDTLKYKSPDASPAPRMEPVKFPTEITVIKRTIPDPIETASDPGQSRPNSMIRISVETHGTPLLLRKPPSGQMSRGQRSRIHIPVIPLKRIKPAQELLEDSQRYRSGQSIYLTRILKRYPMKIECRSRSLEDKRNVDKENVKAGYVKAMVKQLSREGTPDSKGSPKLTLKGVSAEPITRTDSPKSEFVSHIVQKWPSPSEDPSSKSSSPLRDLTNGGQVRKLKQAFDDSSTNGIHERTYSETLVLRKRGSQDIQSVRSESSSSASTVAFSPLSTKNGQQPVSTISSTVTYSSMPMLSLEGEDFGRERSATGSSSKHSPQDSPSQRHRIHVAVSMSPGRSRRIIEPTLSPARMRRLIDPSSPGRRRRVHEPSPIEIVQEEPETSVSVAQSQSSPSAYDIQAVSRRSPKSKRKDKSKLGTIEVLCRQSMTFDLGISEVSGSEGAGAQGGEQRSQTLPIRHSTSSTTSASSQSEVEGASGHSGEKKKSRHKKFMDSSFIQKSKKFFKVSKENRCPSLECCGSDREMKRM